MAPWLDAFDDRAVVDSAEVAVLAAEDGELDCPEDVVDCPDESVGDVVDCPDEIFVEVTITEVDSGEDVELLRLGRLFVDDNGDA